jgi:hypothetical protein
MQPPDHGMIIHVQKHKGDRMAYSNPWVKYYGHKAHLAVWQTTSVTSMWDSGTGGQGLYYPMQANTMPTMQGIPGNTYVNFVMSDFEDYGGGLSDLMSGSIKVDEFVKMHPGVKLVTSSAAF